MLAVHIAKFLCYLFNITKEMIEKNCEDATCIDMEMFSYRNWHTYFYELIFESICIPLPAEIVRYFLEEVIILPKECYSVDEEVFSLESCTSNLLPADQSEHEEEELKQPSFPAFSQLMKDKIASLGGSVFVKTNWRSPKDAFWITAGQTMRCKDINDVYQLIKASNICKEDISVSLTNQEIDPNIQSSNVNQQTRCKQYIIFKKWHEIHPGTEFRCFVRNKRLIYISPRDWPQFHEHICIERINIVADIITTFRKHIKSKFCPKDYVFDVVRDANSRVYLLDFAPYTEKYCDSLAFEWSELYDDKFMTIESEDESEDEHPEFRYLSTDCGIQPNKRNNYGIPEDVINMFRTSKSETITDSLTNTIDDVINNKLENLFLNQPQDEE